MLKETNFNTFWAIMGFVPNLHLKGLTNFRDWQIVMRRYIKLIVRLLRLLAVEDVYLANTSG